MVKTTSTRIPRDEQPSTTTLPSSPSLRRRPQPTSEKTRSSNGGPHALDGQSDDSDGEQQEVAAMSSTSWASRNRWVVFAIASGACAAFNGVFAKFEGTMEALDSGYLSVYDSTYTLNRTTNDLTSHLSQGIAGAFGLQTAENVIELIVRGIFFGLNLVFNGVTILQMWTLFTKALAQGNSTTQVSIMNTSSNFMITAILGLMIFSESLPPLWWLGAAMLVAGNVIIGRKDEGSKTDDDNDADADAASVAESGGVATSSYNTFPPQEEGILLPEEKDDDEEDEDVALIGDVINADDETRNAS